MQNVRNLNNIKFVTTYKRKNQLALESNYHTTKNFLENLIAIEIKKKKKSKNKQSDLSWHVDIRY